MTKSSVYFVEGIHITFGEEATRRRLEQWFLVGYVEGKPFFLQYWGLGAARWEDAGQLEPHLKKRILASFKKKCSQRKTALVNAIRIRLFFRQPKGLSQHCKKSEF